MTTHLDHVAVLVESIEATLARLGVGGHMVGAIEAFPSEGTRECYVGAQGAAARLLLMQATDPRGPYGRALRRRGPGLHHVALTCSELEAFIDGLSGTGWYLLPQSLRTIKASRTAWLGRPGVGTLLEVQEGKPALGAPVVTDLEIPVAGRPALLIAGLQASPDASAWLTVAGGRWPVPELAAHKTDYAGHERVYQRLRDRGEAGWSSDVEDNDARRAWVRSVLAARFPGARPQLLFLGCGAGEFVIDAARAGADAAGIDLSPTAIDMARRAAGAAGVTCRFEVGSVLSLPFASASMDVVVDDHCFHCIIGHDRRKFLAEASRVLRPGGVLLVRSMCSVPGDVVVDPATRCSVVGGVATRHFGTAESLLGEVRDAGFEPVAHRVLPAEQGGSDMLEIEARL